MYYLTFENDVFIDTDLDLKYLKKLLNKYLEKTDFFQVIALGEDKLIKKLLRDYAAYDEDGEYEEIFQGPTDDDFKKVILDNFLNEKNIPNFYKLSLYQGDKLKFEVLNYGEEVSIYGFDQKQVEEAYKKLEEDYGIKNINIVVEK